MNDIQSDAETLKKTLQQFVNLKSEAGLKRNALVFYIDLLAFLLSGPQSNAIHLALKTKLKESYHSLEIRQRNDYPGLESILAADSTALSDLEQEQFDIFKQLEDDLRKKLTQILHPNISGQLKTSSALINEFIQRWLHNDALGLHPVAIQNIFSERQFAMVEPEIRQEHQQLEPASDASVPIQSFEEQSESSESEPPLPTAEISLARLLNKTEAVPYPEIPTLVHQLSVGLLNDMTIISFDENRPLSDHNLGEEVLCFPPEGNQQQLDEINVRLSVLLGVNRLQQLFDVVNVFNHIVSTTQAMLTKDVIVSASMMPSQQRASARFTLTTTRVTENGRINRDNLRLEVPFIWQDDKKECVYKAKATCVLEMTDDAVTLLSQHFTVPEAWESQHNTELKIISSPLATALMPKPPRLTQLSLQELKARYCSNRANLFFPNGLSILGFQTSASKIFNSDSVRETRSFLFSRRHMGGASARALADLNNPKCNSLAFSQS